MEVAQQTAAVARWLRVADQYRTRQRAVVPASRPAALRPACAPCRSMADRTSLPGNGGLAGLALDSMSSDVRSGAWPGADASARCHHHQEASIANSLISPHAPTPTYRPSQQL